MTTDSINWRGNTYPIKNFTIFADQPDDCTEVTVAPMSLWNAIVDSYYADSQAAIDIDNMITCYIDPDDIDLSEPELINIVKQLIY
jgi:hypothetical protein